MSGLCLLFDLIRLLPHRERSTFHSWVILMWKAIFSSTAATWCIALQLSSKDNEHWQSQCKNHLELGRSLTTSLIATSIATIKFTELDLGSSFTTMHMLDTTTENSHSRDRLDQGCQKRKRFSKTKPTPFQADPSTRLTSQQTMERECVLVPHLIRQANR